MAVLIDYLDRDVLADLRPPVLHHHDTDATEVEAVELEHLQRRELAAQRFPVDDRHVVPPRTAVAEREGREAMPQRVAQQ